MASTGELLGASGAVMIISLALGAAALVLERRETSSADLFFTGNRQLRTLPMAFSLVTTLITPLTWLAIPAAVGTLGVTPVLLGALLLLLALILALFVFLPVFFHMQPTTAFEYLEQRFGTPVKLLASGLFVCHTITSLPALLYVPIFVLKEATGLPFLYAGPIVLVTSLVYTALGGMRGSQWASCLHVLVTVCAIVAVVTLSSVPQQQDGEGTWTVLLRDVPHLLSLTDGGWESGVGAAFWLGSQLLAGQPQVQRLLSVPLLTQARLALVVSSVMVLVLVSLLACAGLQMAARGTLLDRDEHTLDHYFRFAEFALQEVASVPGLGGLVIAAIVSLMLSSLSCGVHSLAAVLAVDVWGGRRLCGGEGGKTHEVPAARGRWLMALASLLVLLASALMLLAPQPLLSVAVMFPRITSGSLLGLFCLGMLMPWANTVGALVGAILGLAGVWWCSLGQSLMDLGTVTDLEPLIGGNITLTREHTPLVGVPWLAPLGCAITVVVGTVVSLLACPRDPRLLDPDLVAPLTCRLHRLLWRWEVGEDFEDTSVQEDFEYEAVSTSRLDVAAAAEPPPVRSPRQLQRIPPRLGVTRTGGPYSRGVRVQVERRSAERRAREGGADETAWPDIAYMHPLRLQEDGRPASRPLSGLMWDEVTGQLYLSEPLPPPSVVPISQQNTLPL